MGPYCNYCDQRCFVPDPKRSGYLLATCTKGMEHDRAVLGYDYTAARADFLAELVKYNTLEPGLGRLAARFGFPDPSDMGDTHTAHDGSEWVRGAAYWHRDPLPETDGGQ